MKKSQRPPVIIHRRDALNAGDMASNPAQYFRWLDDAVVLDIVDIMKYDLTGCDVILGGGGMFYDPFMHLLKYLSQQPMKSLTLWGIGRNHHAEHGEIDDLDYSQPEVVKALIEKADLVGLRDCRIHPDWVPCPSVHHMMFDIKENGPKPVGTVLAYQHREDRFSFQAPDGSHSIKSQGSLFDILREIEEHEIVISSSYHGCLWATMLGCKTLSIDGFSQKFRTGLPDSVVPITSSDLKDLDSILDSISPNETFMRDARMRSFKFATEVKHLLKR